MYCPKCGAQLPDDAEFCLKCGDKMGQGPLEEHLRLRYPKEEEVKVRPSVVWKLKGRRFPRGPSPTLRRGRVGESRVVSLDEISL